MNHITALTTSNPIQQAIESIQKLPVTHRLETLYKRSSRNELIFIGAATFYTLYSLSTYIKAKFQKLNLPPSVPFGLPILGHTPYMLLFPRKFLDWCNNRYGELYTISYLGQTVTVANGQCAEEALKSNASDLSLEEGTTRDILHLHYIFDDTILAMNHSVLPATLKLVVPQSKMRPLVPGIQRGLEAAVNDLLNQNAPTIVNHPIDFLQNYVAYMSVPTLLGEELGTNLEVIRSFAAVTHDVMRCVAKCILLPKFVHPFLIPRMQNAFKHKAMMEKHLIPIIRQRRDKIRQAKEAGVASPTAAFEPTYLQLMLQHTDENTGKYSFSESQIAQSVLTVAFASVHTTSTNLGFCIYWLVARPDLKKQLIEEIYSVSPGEAPVTFDELQQLKLLNNFIRESLRQGVDTIALSRKALHDYTFYNGIQVPKGRTVRSNLRQLNFGCNSNRSTIEDMNPEFSNNKPMTTPARDFATFGRGKHLCPGRFFATQEIAMSLVYILKNFEVETLSGKAPYPVQRVASISSGIPTEPLIFTPKRKSP